MQALPMRGKLHHSNASGSNQDWVRIQSVMTSRIADLLQEDVVVAKSLVEDHHTSPRSALIKIVVKKEKETVRQSTHRGSSIRRKETVIKGDKIERRRSDANSSVVATTKEKYGMLNFDM